VRDREFQGVPLKVDADDNTILTLDFGEGLFGVVYGTAAGGISSQFGAGMYFGTEGTIDGVLLNGQPFDFPGRELTAHAPPTDWNAQMCVLPAVVGAHRDLPEAHVFQDIMELVDAVRSGDAPRVGIDQARHVIDIIESGYRSSTTGATQKLATSFELPDLDNL
jgi:predicted dehydrogenase